VFQCYSEYSSKLSEEIALLIDFIFGRTVEVTFDKNPQTFVIDRSPEQFVSGYTCLFSGGLDSYVGIIDARKRFGSIRGVFTKHSDQRQLSGLVKRLGGSLEEVSLKAVPAPKHEKYTRLSRGVLYVLNAFLLRERNIIVPEVGPTMHQPRFTLLDDISITTHPTILEITKRIAEEVVGTKLTIIKPNADLTKAELASIGSDNPSLIRTCSCSSTSYATWSKQNCGVCYACVVRRLALFVAGVKENSYRSDWSKSGSIDNIVHLIRFSIDYLSCFETLPWYTIDAIKKNHKEDLFRRFALDNLAGLLLMKGENQKLVPELEKLLTLVLESFSQNVLKERIAEVKDRTLEPDYGNVV